MGADQLIVFLKAIAADKRVNVWHAGIYHALIHLWINNNQKNPLPISRRKVMSLAKIRSIATYHKCINDLQRFGYIDYRPSYNYVCGTKVFLKRVLEVEGDIEMS